MSPSGKGALLALAAAALFGAGAPLAKLVLPGFSPLALAALLYLGAGVALAVVRLPSRGNRSQREAPLRRGDLFALGGIIVAGGILGPVLLLVGLHRLSALAGSLLLNLEAPLTALLAVWVFREHLGSRGLGSLVLVVLGAALLAYRPGELRPDLSGALSIAGACVCWAIDNNLTQRLSVRDPVSLARIKTLGAGACSLLLALAMGQRISPDPVVLLSTLVLGAFAYGLSIVLATHALRLLGAAREAALFATAPFVGALLSIPLLGDRPRLADGAAGLLMAAGVTLLVTERHQHMHVHEAIEHEHAHIHDEHHQHEHEGPFTEPHAHSHRHAPLTHEHPHASDVHHRHPHK